MPRDTLIDFFNDFADRPGPFLVFDDGYRSWTYSYAEVAVAAGAFTERLRNAGTSRGDKVVLWGENRPEWIVALWGCILGGVVAVPIDYRTSSDFVTRVCAIVGARLVMTGEDVTPPPWPSGVQAWPLDGLMRHDPPTTRFEPVVAARHDVVEIIFTSGATSEPKGVIMTHGNLLANIVPIEREIGKYKKWGRPFFPLRFLNLLPLSHLFGQSMATFIPPLLDGTVIFIRGFNPLEITRQVRERRVSVIVCVPKMLDVLREFVSRTAASVDVAGTSRRWWQRWWRHRDVHALFGWKFWSFVVGAAPLEPSLEEFWSRLGYLVVQGDGLTETAPIVTLNHPFSARKGSVGKPIPGVEIRLAPDGEILVRGENVTRGYYGMAATSEAFEDGWLHTGDVGALDDEGRVYIRGRKKEMIVTADGRNIFPEDVERALLQQQGVRDAAVVGHRAQGEERVHAVLVLEAGVQPDEVVHRANVDLADHQRIRGVSLWPAGDLPRTDGTRKLKRREIRTWVEAGAQPVSTSSGDQVTVESVLNRFAPGAEIKAGVTLDELGLSSLDRVELLMALEERFGVTVEEGAFATARTVADLNALVRGDAFDRPAASASSVGHTDRRQQPVAGSRPLERSGDPVPFPRWNRAWWAQGMRRASLPTWILPLLRLFVKIRVEGLEHLDALPGPVVFAANHQSHLDAPTILAALPPRFRYRVAIAMAKEFFKAHFFPQQYGRRAWVTSTLNYYLASLFFNAFPLPQREAGTRQTLRYVGELATEGWSILIFPEGKRTDAGEITVFRSGVGMMASRLDLPVVPVRLVGLDRILHHSWHMAKPGAGTVKFGAALVLRGDDYQELARQVEVAVRAL
ncbi:MAG: AMP-binding protein [Vicinamibacterales bacterium]